MSECSSGFLQELIKQTFTKKLDMHDEDSFIAVQNLMKAILNYNSVCIDHDFNDSAENLMDISKTIVKVVKMMNSIDDIMKEKSSIDY